MKFYLVAGNLETPEDEILTIVKNKKQAYAFIILHTLKKHEEHFKVWCGLHNQDENDLRVKNNYVLKVWFDELNDYLVLEKRFNKNEMMHCLRVLSGSKAVGGWWEYQDEELVGKIVEASKQQEAKL